MPDEQHVGLHAVVLDGPHLPGTPDARLHLVGDEQDPVLVADVAQLGEPLRRWDDVAALALNRLDDDRGHVFGGSEVLEDDPLEIAAIHRRGRGRHAGQHRAEARPGTSTCWR